MKAQKRLALRKTTREIHVTQLTSLSTYAVIAHEGQIVDASSSGMCLIVDRKSLVPSDLKSTLTLETIIGQQVVMFLPDMNLDLDGTIRRTLHRGRGKFEVAIEFSPEVPEYWRECLVDLLPAPNELPDEEE